MPECVRILIVDDDRADRLAIRRALHAAPFAIELSEAASAREALCALEQQAPDRVAIIDYRLAGDDGLELLRTIRRREGEAPLDGGVPAIVLTGRGDEATAVAAMKAGATDYIPKSELSAARVISALRTGIEIHLRRGEVARAHAALQQAHHEMEQRVRERTAELEHANAELERRNAELDEFTYIASHDLQEPLRKLMAFSDLLSRDLGRELSAPAVKDLRFIVEAARRMQTLVQDLLTLCRAGKSAMRRERVSLDTCVDRALRALSVRVEETGAEITRERLPTVVGDATLLTQLYQNLFSNALKFIAPGCRPRVHIAAEPRAGGGWTLGVSDNGIGVKPEYAEQIFAPFKRLHGRDEYEGTGIGLSVCRKAVERHGGRIWVDSQPGQGAKFRFTLGEGGEGEA
ncbi:MAG: Adaptive-response sensory-kinase SasA [Phycisphaerae bacterium]|nr:Adaptive-response sensory-kinase SasA [Phycisphaerae bacterium]